MEYPLRPRHHSGTDQYQQDPAGPASLRILLNTAALAATITNQQTCN